jgi:glyoxalase family protein
MKIKGIHHISNIVNHPQENIEFYTSLLGLRLIKKAVNFDDAKTYHFYYGNHNGDLGTVITSFPLGQDAKDGKKGGGQAVSTYYIIPDGSFDFWHDRIKSFGLKTNEITRFGKKHLVFSDYLGITNELVEDSSGITNLYEYNGVTSKNSIKGFYGALIHSMKPKDTVKFFVDVLGAKISNEDQDFIRLELNSEIGNYLDINKDAYLRGKLSKGTIHHIAFGVETLEALINFKKTIEGLGIVVTDIKDRNFFNAIYFREPGGSIVELSTMKPGFNMEEFDDRAEKLFFPPHFEANREEIESNLIPVYVNEVSKLKRHHYLDSIGYLDANRFDFVLRRLNELAKLKNTRDLSELEIKEQKELRDEYINVFKNNFKNTLESIEVED